MKCPACDFSLVPITVGKLTVDVCQGGCGGIWFDNFELKKVDDPADFEGAALLHIPIDERRVVDYERRRKCPKCPDLVMMRHFFSERREVEVDHCPGCGGIWLDAGELAAIRKENATEAAKENAAKAYLGRFLSQPFARSRA
ncbi:MAG: zf-TFIIB domain-containing protein [Verrucomicrobia subdivision 3 bacterium]|nr:zf-TFIIB domain-containing protein [Limisphaerales bacterium]